MNRRAASRGPARINYPSNSATIHRRTAVIGPAAASGHGRPARPAAPPAGRSSGRPRRGRAGGSSRPGRRSSRRAPAGRGGGPAAGTRRSTIRTRPVPHRHLRRPTARGRGRPGDGRRPGGQRTRRAAGRPPRTPSEVATAGPARARSRASRRSSNEASSTRPVAPARRIAVTPVRRPRSAFTSMLKWMCGQASSTSSSRGTAADPPIRTVARSAQVSASIRAARPAIRASVASWKTTGTPSAVACTSVSTYRKPSRTVRSKAAAVFSSPSAAPPRWAKASGGTSRKAISPG